MLEEEEIFPPVLDERLVDTPEDQSPTKIADGVLVQSPEASEGEEEVGSSNVPANDVKEDGDQDEDKDEESKSEGQ